jgi:hypothetical protein
MKKYFEGSTLMVELTIVGKELTNLVVGTGEIRYAKSQGTIEVIPEEKTEIEGQVVKGSLIVPEAGVWKFWFYGEFEDGSKVISHPVVIQVHKEGTYNS